MKRYYIFILCVIPWFSLFGAQYIKQGSTWGRIGSGFGKGLAEQLSKEMERGRLQHPSQVRSNNGYYEHTEFPFDPIRSYYFNEDVITLKLNKTEGFYRSKEKSNNFSYIIQINKDIKRYSTVFLTLTDSNGFQIGNKVLIGSFDKGFNGTLRGNFDFRMSENEQICGAELNYHIY